MSFANRKASSDQFEKAVIDRLRCNGWYAERFGQCLLPEMMRDIMKCYHDDYGNPTLLRWLPDIYAGHFTAQGRAFCCLIDVKTCASKTENYAVELSAVEAVGKLCDVFHMPSYFVFDDWGILTAREIEQRGRPGSPHNSGSGTPYCLVARTFSHPFDQMFPRSYLNEGKHDG